MSEGNDAVLRARGVWRSFREGATTLEVLTGVDLVVARAERLAIIGASGSGKTTLLQILGGLDQPNAGAVEVAGRDIHALSEGERSALRLVQARLRQVIDADVLGHPPHPAVAAQPTTE